MSIAEKVRPRTLLPSQQFFLEKTPDGQISLSGLRKKIDSETFTPVPLKLQSVPVGHLSSDIVVPIDYQAEIDEENGCEIVTGPWLLLRIHFHELIKTIALGREPNRVNPRIDAYNRITTKYFHGIEDGDPALNGYPKTIHYSNK